MQRHAHSICPYLLHVLGELPETLDPRTYEKLLPRGNGARACAAGACRTLNLLPRGACGRAWGRQCLLPTACKARRGALPGVGPGSTEQHTPVRQAPTRPLPAIDALPRRAPRCCAGEVPAATAGIAAARKPDWSEGPEALELLQQQQRQDLLAATEPLLALQQPFQGLHPELLQLWYVERAAQVRGSRARQACATGSAGPKPPAQPVCTPPAVRGEAQGGLLARLRALRCASPRRACALPLPLPLQMDTLAGQLHGAVALLDLAAQRQVAGGVPKALGLARALEALVRCPSAGGENEGEGAAGWALGLQELLEMAPEEQVAALLRGSSPDSLERDVQERWVAAPGGGWLAGARAMGACGAGRRGASHLVGVLLKLLHCRTLGQGGPLASPPPLPFAATAQHHHHHHHHCTPPSTQDRAPARLPGPGRPCSAAGAPAGG